MPRNRVERDAVFLNVPYDRRFARLYFAYIAGLNALGLVPHATLQIPGGASRLDRIVALVKRCRYSVHDLSRVQLDRTPPSTPRFNMPFELGLAVARRFEDPRAHDFFCFEAADHRLQKSLSDLNGIDPHIHGNDPAGIMRELGNAFVRRRNQPSVPEMMGMYRRLRSEIPRIMYETGSPDVYQARTFGAINAVARNLARGLRMR